MCARVCEGIYIYICLYAQECVKVFIYICLYTQECVMVFIYIYIYMYIYIYIYTAQASTVNIICLRLMLWFLMRHFSDLPRMLGSSLLSSMVGSALFLSALFVGCNSKLNAGVTALATQAITPAAQAIIVKLTTGMHIQAGIYEKSRCSVRYYQK